METCAYGHVYMGLDDYTGYMRGGAHGFTSPMDTYTGMKRMQSGLAHGQLLHLYICH
jgi:hypothetical protein